MLVDDLGGRVPRPLTGILLCLELISILDQFFLQLYSCHEIFRVCCFKKGEGSPISWKGRRAVAGFYARPFSVSWAFDGGAYLLTVASLVPPPNKESSFQLQFGLRADVATYQIASPAS